MADTNHLALALDELRREYVVVVEERDRRMQELGALELRVKDLNQAIQSLGRVMGEANTAVVSHVAAVDEADEDEFVPDGPVVSPDSPIAQYIRGGGEGRRLSSTAMIVDLVEELDRVITRDDLKDAFFTKFSREDMAQFWERVDNAFGTALARAVKDKQIHRDIRKTDGAELYASRAVVERLRAKRKAAERAAAESDEED